MFFLNAKAEEVFRDIKNALNMLILLSQKNPANTKLEENTKIVEGFVKTVDEALQKTYNIQNGNITTSSAK